MQPIISCLYCEYYIGKTEAVFKCKVFPRGIPSEILTGEHDHTKPYDGDNGIQFEPIEDK